MKASQIFRYEEKKCYRENYRENGVKHMELTKKQVSHSFEVQNIRNQCGGKGRAEETEQ